MADPIQTGARVEPVRRATPARTGGAATPARTGERRPAGQPVARPAGDRADVGATGTPDRAQAAVAGAKPGEGTPDLGAGLARARGGQQAGAMGRFRRNDPAQVKAVQQQLKDLGHYQGEVDGKYGPETDKAVRGFQGQHKDGEGKPLRADGLAGPKTRGSLDAAHKAKQEADKPRPTTPEQAQELAKEPAQTLAERPAAETNAAAEVAADKGDAAKLATASLTQDPQELTPRAVENAMPTTGAATQVVGDAARARETTPNEVVSGMKPETAAAVAEVHQRDGNAGGASQVVYATPAENRPQVAQQTFEGTNGAATAASYLGKVFDPRSQGTANDPSRVDSGTLRAAIKAIESAPPGTAGVGTAARARVAAAKRELERRGEAV